MSESWRQEYDHEEKISCNEITVKYQASHDYAEVKIGNDDETNVVVSMDSYVLIDFAKAIISMLTGNDYKNA